ncbi:hypothetical protein BASA61_005616 [Batrachochytrium salamandrivorans]|nr:hypothetical protein BASA61_005616 [Batrachochytrium salamandrivorans]
MGKRALVTTNPFQALRKLCKTSSVMVKQHQQSHQDSPNSAALFEGAATKDYSDTVSNSGEPSSSLSSYAHSKDTTKAISGKNYDAAELPGSQGGTDSSKSLGSIQTDIRTISSTVLDLTLLLLDKGQTVPLKGVALISTVLGSCQIFGYTMHGPVKWTTIDMPEPINWTFTQVFSPASSSLLQIEAISSDDLLLSGSNTPQSKSDEKTLDLDPEIRRLLRTVPIASRSSIACVVAVRNHQTNIERIEQFLPVFRNIFGNERAKGTLSQMSSFSFPKGDGADIAVPFGFSRLLEEGRIRDIEFILKQRICTVGAKNSGKSTFSRYLVNRLLEKHQDVAFLDCDPGQPGCTPSGIVSLHVINAPLLGPAFTTQLDPYRSFFIGSTTPKNDPDYYIACLCELIKVWRADLSGLPLVVNTNGWIKGMGFDLLVHFLQQLLPSDVVHLSSSQAARSSSVIDFQNILPNFEQVDIRNIDVSSEQALTRIKLNASDQRTLTNISYFLRFTSECTPVRTHRWSLDTPLVSRVPYTVPWTSIRIKFIQEDISFSQSLYALNGTVVGLLVDDGAYQTVHPRPTVQNRVNLKIVPTQSPLNPHFTRCVGLGIIRSIDPQLGQFYVVSPVPSHVLSSVNLIVRSPGLELPMCLIINGYENTRTHLPYTTYTPAEGVGAVFRRNRHLQRRRVTGNSQ